MKILNLLMWVGQFGFSVLFPTVLFLMLGVWLQEKYDLGIWVLAVCGVFGLFTSIRTAASCLRSLLKAAEEASNTTHQPISFNEHT